MSASLVPRDFMEDIWTRDVADLTWDIFRLRRTRANLMRARIIDPMKKVLEQLIDNANFTTNSWYAGDAGAIAEVEAALKKAGMSMDTVMAATLGNDIEEVTRIEQMIANAEVRRGLALQEIERHRAKPGHERAKAPQEVSDAPLAPGLSPPAAAQKVR